MKNKMTDGKRLSRILKTSTLQKLIFEKQVYDALKPFFKEDIKPEDIALIWDILENVRVYEKGTIEHFSKTATGDVKVPTAGKALQVLGWYYYLTTDITTELRFKTSTNVIAGLTKAGACGMNLIGRTPPQGASDEVVEIYLSGAGTVKGWINYIEV